MTTDYCTALKRAATARRYYASEKGKEAIFQKTFKKQQIAMCERLARSKHVLPTLEEWALIDQAVKDVEIVVVDVANLYKDAESY